LGVEVELHDYVNDMTSFYNWADIVICRAGALSISELMAVGMSSILIPYPYAADNHQLMNARYLEQRDAAYVMIQRELTAARLAELLTTLTYERQQLLAMAEHAYRLRKIDASEQIVNLIMSDYKSSIWIGDVKHDPKN